MQALGLIETKGLVAAIESADAMLKAAEVSILEKTHVGGGLVLVAVTGDVAAVKAAVEAGTAAVGRINGELLISKDVIARPHEYLEDTVISSRLLKNNDPPAAIFVETELAAEIAEEETKENRGGIILEEDVKIPLKVVESETTELPVKTVEEQEKTFQIQQQIMKNIKNYDKTGNHGTFSLRADSNKLYNRRDVDKLVSEHGLEDAIKLLSRLKVIELRNLARKYNNFGIKGRSISKAGKQMLIAEFKRFYGHN